MNLGDTYEELYEILALMDKTMAMKIPIDILNIIKEQRNPEYQTNIDKADIFNENNVKKETIELLHYLDYYYWMDENKKNEVDRIVKQTLQEVENNKREKYNPNDIFNRAKNVKKMPENNKKTELLVHRESFSIKIKKMILKILYIFK